MITTAFLNSPRTLGKTWTRQRCNRGHKLEHNRTSNGGKSCCLLCKNMRNALQSEREYFKEQGTPEKILPLEVFAKAYFKGGLR